MSLEVEFQQHAPFLRALARRLAGDQFAAEDLIQETYVEASGGEPRAKHGWLPWLSGILRNRAARRIRTDSRRRSREQVVAQVSDAPDAASVAGKLDVARRLLQHVEALGADYREVVFLRFYDDLQPKQIAAKLGLPVGTVKTRLARALAKLRERLHADDAEGKRNWLPALCALGGLEPKATATATMAPVLRLAFTMRAAVVAVVMLAAGAVIWPWLPDRNVPNAPNEISAAPAEAKEVAEKDNEVVRVEQPANPLAMQVQGIVEDAQFGADKGTGLPARNVAVTCELHFKTTGRSWPRVEERQAATDAAGAFTFTVPNGASVASITTAASDTHRRAYVSRVRDNDYTSLVLTRYPSGMLEGQVIEPSGVPVGGATVTLGHWEDGKKVYLETSADASGRFVFRKVPEQAWLDGQKDGYIQIGDTRLITLAKGGWRPAQVLMAPAATLVVHVEDAAKKPALEVHGVAVRLGERETMGLYAQLNSIGRAFRDTQKAVAGTVVLTVPADLELMLYAANTQYDLIEEGRVVPRDEAPDGQPIKLSRGERRVLRMTVDTSCIVRGRVIGPNGDPMPSAYIQLNRKQASSFGSIGVIEVDAEGRFEQRFHSARPFQALLSASAEIGGKHYGVARLLDVRGQTSFDETLVLSDANVAHCRVRAADGKAIKASVRIEVRLPDSEDYVMCGRHDASSDPQVRIAVDPELEYRGEVSAKGYATKVCELQPGKHSEIVLEPRPRTRVRLRARIASAQQGTPSLPTAPGRFGRLVVRVGYFEANSGAQPEWPLLTTDHPWTRASATAVATVQREAGGDGMWRWEDLDGSLRDGVCEIVLERGPAVILVSGEASNNVLLPHHTTGPVVIGKDDLELPVTFAPTVKRHGQIRFSEKHKSFDAYVAVADDKGRLLSINAFGDIYYWQPMLPASSHGHFAISGIPVGVWELRVGTKEALERGDARWRQRVVFEPGDASPLIIKL